MRKAFAIWMLLGLPVLADSVAATRSWVSNRVAEARAEWRGEVVAATNPVPSWISAAEGRVDGRIAGATNGLPERIASVTNGLPERIAAVTNGLPAKMAALTNGLPEAIAGSTNGLPERIAVVTNGLPERIAAVTNGLPELIVGATNGLPERLAAVTSGVPALVSAATNGVMGEVNAATGALWTAIGNIEGVTADIGALARTNDLPTKVSQLENDAGYLTNHVDVSGFARAAGVFPDWTSKGTWSEGEFCTWRGVVYRFTGVGDPSAQPDISPASWAVSDVGTAIAEARPDMSSLTNPIPAWIAASTNGLPEAIAASTNGLPAKIASVTNGLPELIAASTNGIPEAIAGATNEVPAWIAASTNGIVERATEAALGAVEGLDSKTAYRLSGPPPYDRTWIDGTGAVYEAHAAPLIVSNGVTWTRLHGDYVFPTAAESLVASTDETTWTNGVDETATWGVPEAFDLDGNSYWYDGYPEHVFFTKHMTFADIDPDPTWVAYGYTQHLGTYLWGWTSARLTVIYGSPYMPSGIAETELHFVTAAVKSVSNIYVASLVSASTNATNAVVTVNVTGFPHQTLSAVLTRTLTLPRTVTFRPDAVPVMVDRLAMESAVTADSSLSLTSTNPVQNRAVAEAVDGKVSRAEAGLSAWSVSPTISGPWSIRFARADGDRLDGWYLVIDGETVGFYEAGEAAMTLQFVDHTAVRTSLPTAADLPTKTSDLTNDSGFLTQHQQLAPVYSDTPAYRDDWTYEGLGEGITVIKSPEYREAFGPDPAHWYMEIFDGTQGYGIADYDSGETATTLHLGETGAITATRVRTDLIGYTLGDQTNDVLASTNYLAATAAAVANVATQVLYTSFTETRDTWSVAEFEGYGDTPFRLVWENGTWYGMVTESTSDYYYDFSLQARPTGTGNASATTVVTHDGFYGDLTWTKTGTVTEEIPVYDIVGQFVGGSSPSSARIGEWFDIRTNTWRFVFSEPHTSGDQTVRHVAVFDTSVYTNWVNLSFSCAYPNVDGGHSVTGFVYRYSGTTNAIVVATPRSMNALGLARFSDLDKYAVPRQDLARTVRTAVNMAADYLWDPLDEVCYRRQMSGGFLDYVAVTNIDVTLPENWQALEALEAERRSQR